MSVERRRRRVRRDLRRLGWGDDDLGDGGSDRLVDAIVAWGDEELTWTPWRPLGRSRAKRLAPLEAEMELRRSYWEDLCRRLESL